jgi:outer membrane immunogenic protein
VFLCAPGSLSPATITDSTNNLGWTIGGGFEAALWPNWIARAEYRYSDFGTITNTDTRTNGGGVPPAPLSLIVTYDLTFALAYKFN